MMVIFLVGLVSMILMRTLRKDYARYAKEDDVEDMDRDLGDEYGWKQVSVDKRGLANSRKSEGLPSFRGNEMK